MNHLSELLNRISSGATDADDAADVERLIQQAYQRGGQDKLKPLSQRDGYWRFVAKARQGGPMPFGRRG